MFPFRGRPRRFSPFGVTLATALAVAIIAAGLAFALRDGRSAQPLPEAGPASAQAGASVSVDPDPQSGPQSGAQSAALRPDATAAMDVALPPGASPAETPAPTSAPVPATPDPAAPPRAPAGSGTAAEPEAALLRVSPAQIRQGETALVRFSGVTVGQAFVSVDQFTTPMTEEAGVWVGYVPLPPLSALGERRLAVDVFDAAGVYADSFVGALRVVDARVPMEQITLVPGQEALLSPELVAVDVQTRFNTFTAVTGPRRWQGAWRLPLQGEFSGIFGALRSYNNAPPSDWHHGFDISASAGTPIAAPAAGVVVFTGELPVHGTGVILDHGAGVYSGYWHLSALLTQIGTTLAAGESLGRVGESGLAVGPHLHWEVIVHGRDVDPQQWLDQDLSQ